MQRSGVLSPWYNQMLLLLALTLPATAGLVYIGRVALRRTRLALQVAEALRVETLNRRKTEDALRQAQKMEAIGQLTGGIAHDFNNLLQVISANLHLVGKDVAGNAAVAKRLAYASQAVSNGAALVSQLLMLGRRQPLEPQVINLGRRMQHLEEMVRLLIGGLVKVETKVGDGLWNTNVDPIQLDSAVLNLAINGRDAMQGAGTLSIEAGNVTVDASSAFQHGDVPPGDYVMLAVVDTGAGMTAEVAARAFEPFFTTKSPGAGTGLGLSMVFGLVEQSGGYVRIISQVGRGTAVKLYLLRSDQPEDRSRVPGPEPVEGGHETILVVEDEPAVRAATVEMLSALGYRTFEAANADDALTIIQSGKFVDLLFTDVVMPGTLRSPELAQKSREVLPELAVLYTSGYAKELTIPGRQLGPDVDLLPKPYTADALASRVRAALRKHSKTQSIAFLEVSMEQTQSPSVKPTRVTVLLVEDDAPMRESVAEMVRDLGYPVLEARSAEEAASLIGRDEIGVLIADIGLPGMSGDVFAAEVLSSRKMGVIFATGKLSVRGDPTDANGPVVLHKPFGAAALAAALEQAVKRRSG